MTTAITTTDLRKSYGDKLVLDGIDLEVGEGTVFALLGPNGSGKTTIVQILSTLINADGGSATVGGHDVAQDPNGVRSVIGVTGQFSAVDNLLTGQENLRLMTDLRHLGKEAGTTRIAELLDQFDLVEAGSKHLATYSGGMKRRLDLAMTLVGSPRIIFLDEPTTGLDPRSRHTMWQIVRKLAERTSTATRDISTLVTRIREDSTRARNSMETLAQSAGQFSDRGQLATEDMKRLMDLSSNMEGVIAGSAMKSFVEVAKIDHIVFKFRVYLALFDLIELKSGDLTTHTGCRLGKWYYEGEGHDCFNKLSGYREIEPPHIEVHKAAALALDAYANDDTNALLAHLDNMERASMRVLDNLQKMGEAAAAEPSLLCQTGEGHRH